MTDNSELYYRRLTKSEQLKLKRNSKRMADHSDERYDLYCIAGIQCKLAVNIPKAERPAVEQKWIRNHYPKSQLQWVRHGEEL